jgi:malonyl-CoA/methylmalonyl-CoA synthetase
VRNIHLPGDKDEMNGGQEIMESLAEFFMSSFLKQGKKKSITFIRGDKVETEVSYGALNEDSNQMANTFRDMNVKRGDRVLLFFPKSLIFVVAHLALQKIGAISVPLNPGFKKSEMAYFIDDTDPKLILSGVEQEAVIKEIGPTIDHLVINTQTRYEDVDFFRRAPNKITPAEIAADDPGLIIYTSGTTGKPKGAILTQRNLIHDARNIVEIWEITSSDSLCHALPLFHVHGLCFALHTSLLAGSHVLMFDQFSPETVINALKEKDGDYVCTVFMAVPSMYGKMMDCLGNRRIDFSHMRLWTSGSAPLLPKDSEKIKEVFGKEPVEREGMSETGMNFSNPLKGMHKPGSIGIPLPGLDVRIVSPDTLKDVETGQTGEIWLRGPGVTPGYWQKPGETAEAFENGWFRTGDLGNVDDTGYYYLTDRMKHIIISGGENISPKEIESVINRLDSVAESSVVGIPDEKWGEKVVAAIVPKKGAGIGADEIKVHCRQHLHDWKCPKKFTFLKELPKNTMGKVLTEEVKKFFLN